MPPQASASTPQVHVPGEVTFCVDPDWPPFEQIDAQGQHVGIAADLLKLVAHRSGMNLQLVPTQNWDDSIAASQAGRCQVLSFLNQSPKRDAWLVFTDPVLVDENVVITREEHPFVPDLAGLSNEILVLPKGTSVEERLRRDFPNLKIVLVDSEAQAFKMVSERQADLTMRSLIVAADTIKRQGWFNLKIAGQVPGYGNRLRIGVLKSQAALRDRLNQGVASISAIERQKIIDQHVAIQMVTAVDYTLIGWLAAMLAAVLLTSVYWISRLRRVNAQLKVLSTHDALTGLRNRSGFDALYENELERSRRQQQALSVVLLDIDFFKRINDGHGHPVGDRVLQEVAYLLKQGARTIDHVIRWGGEEFLLLCPSTSTEQAQALAERMLQATRQHDFGLGQPVTLSAGVATLELHDAPGQMFEAVDAALYQAKTQGRNRVVLAQVAKDA
ncbi:MAG: diguanylate cyclase [Rhodoferax ferrireducens]|uniref:diguanylate cyclase n=1 Tax=Rhodoferax ferrireducens TaxID=192843 RepID=A0A1W9KZ18_9BURK|nr:MAG: diguanylate cyclase [Rhodoferax ferrireducens]